MVPAIFGAATVAPLNVIPANTSFLTRMESLANYGNRVQVMNALTAIKVRYGALLARMAAAIFGAVTDGRTKTPAAMQ